jgi:hypothetical protein
VRLRVPAADSVQAVFYDPITFPAE